MLAVRSPKRPLPLRGSQTAQVRNSRHDVLRFPATKARRTRHLPPKSLLSGRRSRAATYVARRSADNRHRTCMTIHRATRVHTERIRSNCETKPLPVFLRKCVSENLFFSSATDSTRAIRNPDSRDPARIVTAVEFSASHFGYLDTVHLACPRRNRHHRFQTLVSPKPLCTS
jgi:hypothetical protein